MKGPTADDIVQKINHVSDLYYRLVIVAAPAGSGKTVLLKNIHELVNSPIINVNLELSKRMLCLTEGQRILRLSKLLSEIIDEIPCEVVLLDNIEMLFDVSLKQDPLRLLLKLSRRKTIVTSWNGTIENDHLTYAEPDHVEYKRYPIHDITIIFLGEKT